MNIEHIKYKLFKLAIDAPPMIGNIDGNKCTKGHSIRQFSCFESESFSHSDS